LLHRLVGGAQNEDDGRNFALKTQTIKL
jgi:hypothetical protein